MPRCLPARCASRSASSTTWSAQTGSTCAWNPSPSSLPPTMAPPNGLCLGICERALCACCKIRSTAVGCCTCVGQLGRPSAAPRGLPVRRPAGRCCSWMSTRCWPPMANVPGRFWRQASAKRCFNRLSWVSTDSTSCSATSHPPAWRSDRCGACWRTHGGPRCSLVSCAGSRPPGCRRALACGSTCQRWPRAIACACGAARSTASCQVMPSRSWPRATASSRMLTFVR